MNHTTNDFDGCRRTCRLTGAHTLVWGDCEHAAEPEPTVSLSRVYTDTDGLRSIGFDTYTVPELARLIEPVLGDPLKAAAAARRIVHRHDEQMPAAVPVPPPADRATLRVQIAEALYTHNHPGWATRYNDLDQDERDTYLARADAVLAVLPEQTDDERPLSPDYEHPECGFHWHGRDGMDIPMRDGQPVCPRCELAKVEKKLAYTQRTRDEVGEECKRRGRIKLEQAERIIRLERELDGVRDQLGKEMLRADDAEAELRRLAAEQPPAPREWCKCRSCWGWFVEDHPGEDLDELARDLGWWSGLPVHRDAPAGVNADGSRLAAEQPTETQDTLPAWLAHRFDPRGADWDGMSDDDRSYWEHHAQAVRRAVARGGFKPTTERPAVVEQPDTHTPRRGDQVEAWLKQQRDERRDDDHGQWSTLDALLDAYRLHADTSTPLGERICEGRVVGDCECLEQPDTEVTDAPPREPHPTQVDMDHALTVWARFRGQDAGAPDTREQPGTQTREAGQ
jgi:hypothetical protein